MQGCRVNLTDSGWGMLAGTCKHR